MSLTPREEMLHLEVKALRLFTPRCSDEVYVYKQSLHHFIDYNYKDILDILAILDQHLDAKASNNK